MPMEGRAKCTCGCRRGTCKFIAYHPLPFGKTCDWNCAVSACFNKIKTTGKCSACGKAVRGVQWKKRDYDGPGAKEVVTASDWVNSGAHPAVGGATGGSASSSDAPAPTAHSPSATVTGPPKPTLQLNENWRGKVSLAALTNMAETRAKRISSLKKMSQILGIHVAPEFNWEQIAKGSAGTGWEDRIGEAVANILVGMTNTVEISCRAESTKQLLQEALKDRKINVVVNSESKDPTWSTRWTPTHFEIVCNKDIGKWPTDSCKDMVATVPTGGALSGTELAEWAEHDAKLQQRLDALAACVGLDTASFELDRAAFQKIMNEQGWGSGGRNSLAIIEGLANNVKRVAQSAIVKEAIAKQWTTKKVRLNTDSSEHWLCEIDADGYLTVHCAPAKLRTWPTDCGKDLDKHLNNGGDEGGLSIPQQQEYADAQAKVDAALAKIEQALGISGVTFDFDRVAFSAALAGEGRGDAGGRWSREIVENLARKIASGARDDAKKAALVAAFTNKNIAFDTSVDTHWNCVLRDGNIVVQCTPSKLHVWTTDCGNKLFDNL